MTSSPGIYEIRNTVNGNVYIGSAVMPEYRKNRHIADLSKGTHCNRKLQSAWDRYGAASFVFSVILHCAKQYLIQWEQIAIDGHASTFGWNAMYNIVPKAGSQLGSSRPKSPEQIIKWRESRRGYIASAETRAKISAANRGQKRSPEVCAKIGAGHKGKIISPEARAKMSVAKKGKSLSAKARANMSASVRARGPEYHANLSASKIGNKNSLGRKHPPEVLAKISAASKAMWAARRAKATHEG